MKRILFLHKKRGILHCIFELRELWHFYFSDYGRLSLVIIQFETFLLATS